MRKALMFLLFSLILGFYPVKGVSAQGGVPVEGTPLYTFEAASEEGEPSSSMLASDVKWATVISSDIPGYGKIHLDDREFNKSGGEYDMYFKLSEKSAPEGSNTFVAGLTSTTGSIGDFFNDNPWAYSLLVVLLVLYCKYYVDPIASDPLKPIVLFDELNGHQLQNMPLDKFVIQQEIHFDPNADVKLSLREIENALHTTVDDFFRRNLAAIPLNQFNQRLPALLDALLPILQRRAKLLGVVLVSLTAPVVEYSEKQKGILMEEQEAQAFERQILAIPSLTPHQASIFLGKIRQAERLSSGVKDALIFLVNSKVASAGEINSNKEE